MSLSDIISSFGSDGKEIKNDILKIRGSYGVNHPVTGEFDKSLAAKCENGVFIGKKRGQVTEYRGIPFAAPPVGRLRWKKPEPAKADTGVYEAYYNGMTPVQTEWETERASYYPQSEDCLYLNVFVNRSCGDKNKAVMVFFHGGSYGWGGTADPLYDGKNFVAAHPDIVLVTVGYRTGLMGFVDFSDIPGGEEYPDAPNLGLLDQIEALRWINKNISAFGGDRDNVTIFGESAGGGSVSLLPVIGKAKGLFRRVIAESGSVALTFSKDECRSFTRRLIDESGACCMDDLVTLTEAELRIINEKLNAYNNFPQRDGRLIPLDPYAAYENGETADIDMLIGTNANETNYWVGEIGGIVPFYFGLNVKFENDLRILSGEDKKSVEEFMSMPYYGSKIWRIAEFYNEVMFRLPAVKQAEDHSRGGRVYMYYWAEPSVIPFRGACHAVELAYVFGNLDETIYTGKRADESLSRLVMQMWANFAKTGDPSTSKLAWTPYSVSDRSALIISLKPRMRRDILKTQRETLMPVLKYMINASYAELDYNVPFVRKAIAAGIGAAALTTGGIILAKRAKRSKKNGNKGDLQ